MRTLPQPVTRPRFRELCSTWRETGPSVESSSPTRLPANLRRKTAQAAQSYCRQQFPSRILKDGSCCYKRSERKRRRHQGRHSQSPSSILRDFFPPYSNLLRENFLSNPASPPFRLMTSVMRQPEGTCGGHSSEIRQTGMFPSRHGDQKQIVPERQKQERESGFVRKKAQIHSDARAVDIDWSEEFALLSCFSSLGR